MPDQLGLNLEPCAFCGAQATKLCDYPLGRVVSILEGGTSDTLTCDTPFCNQCGKAVSAIFLDGADKRGRRMGWRETVDHCLVHKLHPHGAGPLKVMTVPELEKARAEIRAAIELAREGKCLLKP